MCIYDMITWADEKYRAQAYDINNQYFSVDTAEPEDVYDWVNHNRLMLTYALRDDEVRGFINLMPLTREAGELFERNAIKEEEITTEHILAPNVMHYAEYLYFPAIAVSNFKTYAARQCTAALMSAMCSQILTMYDPQRLKKIFVNPTTFPGNRMTHKLGLEPLTGFKKPLTGNDLYFAKFNDALFERLRAVEQRYSRFVGYNCWQEKDWAAKLAAANS
jgi:hypothetical protein